MTTHPRTSDWKKKAIRKRFLIRNFIECSKTDKFFLTLNIYFMKINFKILEIKIIKFKKFNPMYTIKWKKSIRKEIITLYVKINKILKSKEKIYSKLQLFYFKNNFSRIIIVHMPSRFLKTFFNFIRNWNYEKIFPRFRMATDFLYQYGLIFFFNLFNWTRELTYSY